MKKNAAWTTPTRTVCLLVLISSLILAGNSKDLFKNNSESVKISNNFLMFQDSQKEESFFRSKNPKFSILNKILSLEEAFGENWYSQNDLAFLAPPSISSISPSTPQTSVTDQNVRVNGSNFASGLTVTVTFPSGGTGTLSGSQIVDRTSSRFTMKITLNATGTWRIRVNNPNGEQSNTFSFNVVAAQNPVISSISPSSPTVSNSDQNINVSGSNFQDGMTVTVFFPGGGSGTLSGSQLQNITPTSFRMVVTLNLVGTYGIRINNPSGRQSNTFQFQTQNPSPTISSINPSGVCAQNGDRTFSVSGNNFQSGLTVTVFFPGGGSTTLSGSQIQYNSSSSFNMTATLNVVGTYNFRVNNPNGSSSPNFPYTTQNCNPSITSISPSTPTVSNSNQTVSVSGSNFQNGLTVTVFFPGGGNSTLSGSQIQFISSSSFNMIITLNIVGQYQIRVNNPNGTSSPNFSFNTQAAPPTISSITPSSPCVRNTDQSVTVNGSGFINGLTVLVTFPGGGGGTLSGSQIQNITSNSFTMIITLADPGSYTIRINNPGNSQSAPFTFTPQNCLSVSGINPSSPTQSNTDQNVTVNGNGFASGLTVIVTLPDNTTVTLSGAQILNVTPTSFTMRITLNATGTWKIKVRNSNGNLSNIFSFTVLAPAPPVVTAINPTSPTASNIDQNVIVSGNNFQSGLTVTVTFPNGGSGTLSGTQIQNVTNNSFTMRITLGNSGSWSLRVNNPNGGQSSPFGFTVQSNVQSPAVFSINPATPVARSTDQDIIVSGNNFQPNLVVDITFPSGGGTTLSGTQIQNVTSTSFIMRATLNAVGNWTIKVRNTDGGQSAIFGFSVTGGTNPVINSINPNVPTMNGADQNVIVNGGNFQNGLKVNVTFPNGGVSTLQGTGQIQNVTANSFLMRITVNATGTWNIRVINPDNSQSQQFAFNVQAAGPPPTGLPTSVLSPVIGPLRVTTSNQRINDGKWEFNQHKTGNHTPTGGISRSNDTFAWDINLYTPTSGNADAGKPVFAVAAGEVVSYVGTPPGDGPGAVLIAHPNKQNPVWFSGYLHMTNVRVTLNQVVDSSTLIGELSRVGANNDRLHFVVYSGQNIRGNLQSFNVSIIERLTNTTNPPVINSINPPSVVQSSDPQLITISGINFQTDSIIEVEDPNGNHFTITPEAVSGFEDSGRITSITATTITARVPFAFANNYEFAVINRTTSASSQEMQNQFSDLSGNCSQSCVNVTAGPAKTPIILIPGIMGSRLAKREANGLRELWIGGLFNNAEHRQLKDNVENPAEYREISHPDRKIVATEILKEAANFNIYGKLVKYLTDQGYKVSNLSFPFSGQCQTNNPDADLYIFAYDWRNSNWTSARDLYHYIQCVKNIRAGTNFKVDIVAHSMGGLVARRYILNQWQTNSPHYVDRMVTLGTPWLGAPKTALAFENGDLGWQVNAILNPLTAYEIAPYIRGLHELIPSKSYVNDLTNQNSSPGDFPFGERHWDINDNDRIDPIYDFIKLKNFYNDRYGPWSPGTATETFHNQPFQDNWSNDPTGVNNYNFIGVGQNNTVGSVIATWGIDVPYLDVKYTRGDKTVTDISASRQSALGNYSGAAYRKWFNNVDHNELTSNLNVLRAVKCVIREPNPNSCLSQVPSVQEDELNSYVGEPIYNLKVVGSPLVSISDSFGNTTSPLSTSNFEGVPTISTDTTGSNFLSAIIPQDQNYKMVLKAPSTRISILLTKSDGQVITQAIRYVDITLPPNVLAMFEITPQGVTNLAYDSDGNGTFETPVNPTINVTGTQAQDVEPPNVIVNETIQNGMSQVVLEATDTGTGVRQIMYSINGTTFQPYANPLTLNPAQTPTIYVFADDNVFNRSGLTTHNLTASNAGFAVSGPSVATPGSQITANWNAPGGRPTDDWIGLFRVGNLNSSYLAKQYTGGATSGNLNFTTPTQPGTYEFRYLLNDGFSSVVASNQIVVSGSRSPFDFDGDGRTDIGILRPAAGEWWIQRSSDSSVIAAQFGSATDKLAAADYTGDGKADVAFWRPSDGNWYVLRSEDFSFYAFPFGTNGDRPVPADYDGDGRADAAVFRESNQTWYISLSSGGVSFVPFGSPGDAPMPADYDGDGKADIAITRINGANREWWIRRSSDGQIFAATFGEATDKAVAGDYTGDGKADVAVFRPSTGFWYILRSEDGSFYAFPFGASGDIPTPGDYDGDGRFDAAVFRQSNSVWYQLRTTSGFTAVTFGIAGDVPIPSSVVP